MFHQDTRDGERIEELIVEALREILAHENAERYLAWASRRIPQVLGLIDSGLTGAESQRVATLLAVAIWSATPLPTADFRPTALPLEGHADCPCGSGAPFQDCCGRSQELPDLSSEVIWELLLSELPERDVQRAMKLGAIPQALVSKVAERWLELDRPGRAIALLEPLFAADPSRLEDGSAVRRELALEVLCDAYDRLDHWKKKRAFLNRMTEISDRALRGAAWRRLSAGHLDDGDFVAAHHAFVQALRQSPDDPGLAFLEIALLTAEHRDEEARRRAELWRHRFVRLGLADEEVLTFLEEALEQPQEALLASQAPTLDPALIELHGWLHEIAGRPLPRYRLAPLPDARETVPSSQLNLFQGEEVPADYRPQDIPGTGARLQAGASMRRLEDAWHQVFPGPKPYSTQLTLVQSDVLWASGDWIPFLLHHPEASGSLDILDDLATAIYSHPESALPWVLRALLPPLLERAKAIIDLAVPRDRSRTIPWSSEQNRPALRLLFRHYLYQLEAGDLARATEILEDLLRLNPRDNHGVRADLMNHYLRDRQDDKALALARRFPDDRLADLAYGEVLALYRLGEPERAKMALNQAVGRLPRIPAYLTRQRIKPPKRTRWPTPPTGEDQAWLYREAMRDVWAAEPGVLAWLKRMTA